MLLSDDNHKCLIMALSLKGIKVLSSDSNNVQLKVSAGEDWDKFVKYCIKNNYWGCEICLIPDLLEQHQFRMLCFWSKSKGHN